MEPMKAVRYLRDRGWTPGDALDCVENLGPVKAVKYCDEQLELRRKELDDAAKADADKKRLEAATESARTGKPVSVIEGEQKDREKATKDVSGIPPQQRGGRPPKPKPAGIVSIHGAMKPKGK